ncbi:uncharacterized protein SAPINGB_P004684 [Magnusiomyces paraingens]|uniref:AAA+ ATPase domain-containing protein n=1 Tax=Magnusiomyces paraingens TaxID=2606893 RepID=A0A5E8BW33_9ASCO|nr:uncharacterized protein SAPINGB_P004684 [Saprochaete ingens]VVT55663.1 unnamed protein product [Saprochaete ingens]
MTLAQVNNHLDRGCNLKTSSHLSSGEEDKLRECSPQKLSHSSNQLHLTDNKPEKDKRLPNTFQLDKTTEKRPFSSLIPPDSYKNDTNSSSKHRKLGAEHISTSPSSKFQSPSKSKSKILKKSNDFGDKPLAELIRPKTLDEFIGQEDLVGKLDTGLGERSKIGILRQFIEGDKVPSMILWGPSGVGKTTLARIIAHKTKSRFIELSATIHGTSDCKKIFEEAKNEKRLTKRRTIIFLDEVHRFNKAQQDVFLPHVERGDVTLIGATTENPSFKINGALLSRCRVFVLKKLTQKDLEKMMKRAVELVNKEYKQTYDATEADSNQERYPSVELKLSDDIIKYLSGLADGDGRVALNILEMVINMSTTLSNNDSVNRNMPLKTFKQLTVDEVRDGLKRTHMLYDRNGDGHYDTISAFHKSVRGSDPDAALYYLGRMLESGEDPLYVARRMVRMASEDIGLAADDCLPFAVATMTAVQQIGMPEADVVLAHCAVKLATAPKSVMVYRGYNKVKDLLHNEPGISAKEIPLHIRNAPTKLMKTLGYGKEYKYNPDFIDGKVKQNYMPEGLEELKFIDFNHHLGSRLDPELEDDKLTEVKI